MPSIRSKLFASLVRFAIKSRGPDVGELEFARHKRMRFGTPKLLQGLFGLGLSIKRVADGDLAGEWILPPEAKFETVILYIHGGGFISCSAGTHRPITTGLARRTALPVFATDYRLAPEHRFPSALDDVFSAYRSLREKGNVIVAGDSAGGGLALSLLLRARDAGIPMPTCAIGFSPWADLTPRAPDCLNAELDPMFFPENVEQYAALYLNGASALEPLASPALGDLSGLPPLLLQVGSTEILLEDARLVHEKILAAGGQSRLEIFDSVMHCWQMLVPFVPEAGLALDQAAEFIKEQT